MDFHTHTPLSDDYANGERDPAKKQALRTQTPSEWLTSHMSRGLDAVVITDHNSTGFISRLKDAYTGMSQQSPDFRPLVIFPGFELSVNGGLHLLAVFDPAADLESVSGVITACGYKGARGHTNDGVSAESFENCIKIIKSNGGLTIAAHIDEPCGLLWRDAVLNGREYRNLRNHQGLSHAEALQQMIKDGIVAASIADFSPSVGQTLDSILEAGLDAVEVRRWATLPDTDIQRHPLLARLARVAGSDSHHPAHIGRNGFAMVHMTQPNLEGLRMAFADGSAIKSKGGTAITDSWSVRTVSATEKSDWNHWPNHAVEKLTISQIKMAGRVMPLEMPLHPQLNVLVGGRGSGKSTMVHALRLATNRGRELPRYEGDIPVQESPAGDFWRWARIPVRPGDDGVILKAGEPENSTITVLYRSPAQLAELRWHASLLGQGQRSDPPSVHVGGVDAAPAEDGGAYSASRFPISIYSQKQVLEMSRGPAGLLGIIDREQNIASLDERLKQAIAAYSATKAKVRELNTTLANEAQDQANLKDILVELEKVQSDTVKEFQKRQAQARALLPNLATDSQLLLQARKIREQADRLSLSDLPPDLIPEDDAAALEAHTIYQNVQKELAKVAVLLRDQATNIEVTLNALNDALRNSAWFTVYEESRAAFDALLGTQSASFDPARLTKLDQDRAQLEVRLAKYKGTREEIGRHDNTATEQMKAVREARIAIRTARESFVTTHNAKGTMLRMTLVSMGADDAAIERSLREALGVDPEKFSQSIGLTSGSRPDSLMRVFKAAPSPQEGTEAVRQRILALIDSAENEQGFADLQNNLRRQLVNTPSRRDAIETWFPGDRLKLEYRTAESSHWKSISQGSIGQQTAAVLSFLLSFGEEPLVLDQPEDDLDTRMVMSLIVEQVRTMKQRRQIIIITHNPNIVVHGDADLVHAMVDQGGQVLRDANASGGLQEKATRTFICDVMEGGAIAFRKRFDRMGREEP